VNLVGNAVKFTERGEVVVWAGVIHRAAERVLFRVAVRDTGIGIAPEAREHLFQSFMQADGSMTRRYGGTGLGLAISKELVALMGGDIGCDSRPGHGSEFWFTAWLGVPAGAACASPVEPRWNGRKALIVEDSAAASEVLERSLRQWGMETRSVSDPGAALETLRAVAAAGAAYDVAFLDLELLESRGAEFLRQVRGDPLLAALRTILCRPAGPGSPATKAIEAEAAQVLSKPIRRRQLQACLDSCFQVEPRTAGGAPGPDAGRPAAPAGAARETRGAVGLRILVADDMADNRRLLQLYLKRLGCDAETVADGAAVLRATEEAPFDVILLDCHMPEVDGFEATRRLREREAAVGPGAHRTTIVAVTALALPGDRERCLAAGMDECLCKPVRFAELAAVIESRVGAHGAA